MELTRVFTVNQEKSYKSFKHVSLSGLKGFLKQFDKEQSVLLARAALTELTDSEAKFSAALRANDRLSLKQICEEVRSTSSSFQIDFLAVSAQEIREKFATGKIKQESLTDFLDHFSAVTIALGKLVVQLEKTSDKQTQKVGS